MIDNQAFTVAVLRHVTSVVSRLKAEQIEQLVEGRAELAFLPPGASIVFPGPDPHKVQAQLAAVHTREAAAEYVAGLKLKKPELVALAKQLGVAVASKDTVAVLQRKIIENTVGARVDASAIRDPSWQR